jgi:hypothetical protein
MTDKIREAAEECEERIYLSGYENPRAMGELLAAQSLVWPKCKWCQLLWKRCKNDSLILAYLTRAEYARFEKAKIMCSGSSGADAKHGVAPYIVTFLQCLPKAIRALRWKRPRLTFEGGQWMLRKERRSH